MRRRTLRTGVIAIVACLLGAAIPVALASEWSTVPAQLSQNVGDESATAPSMAIADNGDIAAVWLEQSVSGTSTSDSLDGVVEDGANNGAGFGSPVDLGAADPLSQEYAVPSVAEDGNGDAVAVWIDNGHVVWSEQEQPAASFTAATSAASLDGSGTTTVDSYAHVAMDSGGDAIAVWAQQDRSTAQWSVWYAILPAGRGQTFGEPVPLATGLTSNPFPQVAINQDGGDAIMSYIDGGSIDESETYFGGADAVWPTPVTIYTSSSSSLSQLVAAMNEDGETVFAWVDGGTVWSGDLVWGDTSFTQNSSVYAAAAVDSGGTQVDPAVAIYPSDQYNDDAAVAFYNATDDDVVVATRSTAQFVFQGNVWSAPTIKPASPSSVDQQPQLSIAGDGVVTLLWEGPGTPSSVGDVEAIRSDTNGAFSGSTPVTLDSAAHPCATASEAPCVVAAADPSGDVAAAWAQNDMASVRQIDAQCLEADSDADTGTSTTVAPDPSTFSAASCVDTNTTPTTTTATTNTQSTTTTTTTNTQTTITSTETTTTATPTETTGTAAASSQTSTETAASTTPTISSPTTTGTVLVKLAGSNKFVAVDPGAPIPNGSVIDASRGTVRLTFRLPDGSTETASFWGGQFSVTISSSGAVKLVLVGGSFKGCPKPTKHGGHEATAARAKKPTTKKPGSSVRSLWSNAKGNFTTSGKDGAAAVLGTTWLVRDQCDGTYFYVKKASDDPHGAILVTVLHPHRHTVKLKRGHSLLAPAPGY